MQCVLHWGQNRVFVLPYRGNCIKKNVNTNDNFGNNITTMIQQQQWSRPVARGRFGCSNISPPVVFFYARINLTNAL